jgi:putative membrane protein
MSASVTHSFLDFVPSVFIGAPDSEDSVSVLPGHRLLMKGRGMEAVRAAAIGSLVGTSCAILMAIPLQYALRAGLDGILGGLTPLAVAGAATVLIISQFRKGCGIPGTAAFIVSGALGAAVMWLPIPSHGIAGEGSLMFPMLSGLFGVPAMVSAASEGRMPAQSECPDPEVAGAGLRGVLMGCAAGWFPGITSTVGASISACFMPENRPERFIASVASIGSVTAVLSIVTLSVSGSGRSGTALAIGEIAGDSLSGVASQTFVLLLMAAAIGSLLGYSLTVAAGRLLSSAAGRIDQRRLNLGALALTSALVLILTGPFGLAVLAVSAVVGSIPQSFGTDRTILCGCLLLPVLLMQLRSEPGPGLGHEAGIVHDEALVDAGPYHAGSVPDFDPEDKPPAVGFDEFGLADCLRSDGGRSGMLYFQTGPDGALAFSELVRHAFRCHRLYQRNHRRGRVYLQIPASQGDRGVLRRDLGCLPSFRADLHGQEHGDRVFYGSMRPIGMAADAIANRHGS